MITLLLIIAVVLGLVSFFEPCTIATHALFSVRLHERKTSSRLKNLLAIWLTRSILLSGLLVVSVLIKTPPLWIFSQPGIVLAALATLYIVSRFVYVPVPHLEFYKLAPNNKTLPHSVQLGLTLPACTIPLFLIVTGIALAADSIVYAVLAGFLFSGSFTLPVGVIVFNGIRPSQNLLNNAGKITPFLTAILLYGAAGYLLLKHYNNF